jgi:hypothetical protein
MIELIFYTFGIMLFFGFAGALAWLLDRILTFHLEGMERVRRQKAKERASE